MDASVPTEAELNALFDAPGSVPDNTFEIALVLGGTVSAGAYTAGVLDFLFEALDEWTSLAEDDPRKPKHKVVLKLITGASGGAVNAAIASKALAYKFPHIVRSTPIGSEDTGNPFYDVWVKRLNLIDFLGTSDLDQGNVTSLLNGEVIDQAANYIVNYSLNEKCARRYVADPLRIILTLTNLRGIPYQTDFGPVPGSSDGARLTETFVEHADYARFAIVYPGHTLSSPRPDEFVLGFDGARVPQGVDWRTLADFAKGSSAFPVGLPARALSRPIEQYRYRVKLLPGDAAGKDQIVTLPICWELLKPADGGAVPDDYHFTVVDGGVTDNEPIELARTALAGITGRNPREGTKANRAVLLVDPFAGSAQPGAEKLKSLFDTLGAVVGTVTEQTRYDSSDLQLAVDPNVYSRFMITPIRGDKVGGDAIASSGLDAFLGFASNEFRRHDYLLGRLNAQQYLREVFVLPREADVFMKGGDTWSGIDLSNYWDSTGKCLPIIPLMGAVNVPEMPEPWPKNALNPERFKDAIETRIKAIIEAEGSGFLGHVLAWLAAHLAEGTAADFVIRQMQAALAGAGLH